MLSRLIICSISKSTQLTASISTRRPTNPCSNWQERREEMEFSKIISKDTFEILGRSAPNVFENRTHSIRMKKSASAKKVYQCIFFLLFFFLGTPYRSARIFQRISVFATV